MKIATKRDYVASLESIAMTDIVMNLFIFFFISFSLIYTFNPSREERVKVQLPKDNVQGEESKIKPITLSITKESKIFLGEQELDPAKVEEEVRALLSTREDKTIYLRADTAVNYGFVMETLAKTRSAGATVLALGVKSNQ